MYCESAAAATKHYILVHCAANAIEVQTLQLLQAREVAVSSCWPDQVGSVVTGASSRPWRQFKDAEDEDAPPRVSLWYCGRDAPARGRQPVTFHRVLLFCSAAATAEAVDPGLSLLGQRQASQWSDDDIFNGVQLVLISPLRRAVETASHAMHQLLASGVKDDTLAVRMCPEALDARGASTRNTSSKDRARQALPARQSHGVAGLGASDPEWVSPEPGASAVRDLLIHTATANAVVLITHKSVIKDLCHVKAAPGEIVECELERCGGRLRVLRRCPCPW